MCSGSGEVSAVPCLLEKDQSDVANLLRVVS